MTFYLATLVSLAAFGELTKRISRCGLTDLPNTKFWQWHRPLGTGLSYLTMQIRNLKKH